MDPPVQKVLDMRKQGLSDNQIIQSLQQEGFDSQIVLEAMEMADEHGNQNFNQNNIPPQNQMKQQPSSVSSQKDPVNPIQNNQPPPSNNNNNEDMEELIEAVIDEKWSEVEKNINKVLEWKDSVDERIGSMKSDIDNLKKNFEDLHKAILGKIGDYDKNINEVGSQLKAMEKVFSNVLPTFSDNVNELNRIADKLKNSDKKN
ncbi:MAG: hypothetical protein ACQER9_01890 [Nanobdellota archaeon]